jgi:choline dehydrogenase-like flavoprotein
MASTRRDGVSQYDYVVVGGGSAGSVLASRLTEDEDTDVLLLDAGKDWRSDEAPPEIRSPNFFFCLFELEEEFMWPTMEATLTAEKEPERYYVGKGLGGGSTVNAQFFVHPPMEDFDQWEELGADGWSGDDVSGYFREMERDGAFGDRPYHGDDGPIPVWRREREEWMAIDRALYDAATDLGHSESRDMDFNSPDKEGISMVPFNVEDGERVSTNDAYIEPVRGRDNLTIQGETLVDTVLFDGREAVGVEALGPDQRRRTDVADEVSLSAGAVQTPGILMRSGIGPESQLADIDVGVKIDHPGIGRLIDHPLLSLSYDLTEEYQADPPAPEDV